MTFLAILFLTLNAQTILSFEIAGKTTDFYQHDNMRLMSNLKCESAKNGKLCNELEFLKTLKNKEIKLKKDALTGAIGSDVCTEGLKGTLVLGFNKISKSQNMFCNIDNTLLDIGTITYYRMNGK